jgi:two-component system cell cycle response regulator
MHTVRRDPDAESDVYILFETGPDDGIRDTLIALRSHPVSRRSRILFVTDCTSRSASPLDLGADDQVPTEISPSELTLRITRLARGKRDADRKSAETQELAQKAYVDALTGLNNRTAMEDYLVRMDRALADQPKAIAVMIADLDHFKAINDSHGHAAGDVILAKVAQTLKSKLRDSDFIARYGGEEFLIVLPNVKRDHARDVAMRLRDAVADTPIALTSGTVVRATISIGLAVAHKSERKTTRDLQRAADTALYSAKRSGRNRIELAQMVSPLGRHLGGSRAEL